jgi:Uma2 family endonuclease
VRDNAILLLFAAVLFFWLVPGILRIWMKREMMEVTGVARTPEERHGYDRRDWLVFWGLMDDRVAAGSVVDGRAGATVNLPHAAAEGSRMHRMTTTTRHITADELLAMGDIGRCELIYGELVMMSPAGLPHGVVAMRIGSFLREFVDARDLGLVLAAETGFKVETDPDLVRAPDASFVRKDRLPSTLPHAFFDGVPDLAVEVVSPDDSKREVAEKVNMWLAHGTTSCWVADPETLTITIYRTGKQPVRLTTKDEVRDEPTLPGFVMPVAPVFARL